MKSKSKIIVILGQTATGKSDLGVELAKKFNGEIISADSRQVYKDLNIGTGKVSLSYESRSKRDESMKASTPFFCEPARKGGGLYYKGIRHHLLDVVNPKEQFSVAKYKKLADQKINKIINRGKIPILVGGTGFYIQVVVDGIIPPEVSPNFALRKELKNERTEELMNELIKLDPERALVIDPKNSRRLIRAIEIAKTLGKVPSLEVGPPNFEVLQIGIQMDDKELKDRISKRLFARIREGMIKEVEQLHEKGLSWKRMEELGLEYRYLARYLQGKITKKEMIEQLNTAIWHYAKRQKTWFKRDKRIYWFKPNEIKKIEKLVKEFYL